jgi:uncharacterized protein YkwD
MSASLVAAPPAPPRRPASVALTLLLTVLALVASVTVAPAAGAEVGTEDHFVAQLNAERSARGLPTLRVTQDLTDVARAQSDRMAAADSIFHNPNLANDVAGWLRVSENVGYGPDAVALHVALMNSAGHRANILDTVVTQVGIGTTWDGSRLYVTQVFRRPDNTTVNAPGMAPPPPPPPAAPPAQPVDLGLAACPSGLPTGSFGDVPTGTAAAAAVDCAAWWTLMKGVAPGRFDPHAQITRAQVASLIARKLAVAGRLPTATRDYFNDDNGTVHEANANALAQVGILTVSKTGRFYPQRGLSRDQLASILVRVQEHLLGRTLPNEGTPFVDIAGNIHAGAIAKAYGAGLASGTSPTTYDPARVVPRRQMAAFLVRAVDDLVQASIVRVPGR